MPAARAAAELSFTVPAWSCLRRFTRPRRSPRRPPSSHAVAVVHGWPLRVFEIATAVGVACALLALTSGPVFIDFEKAYLYAGRVAFTEPSRLYECTRGQCFVNIPIVALLFAPLARAESRALAGRALLDRRARFCWQPRCGAWPAARQPTSSLWIGAPQRADLLLGAHRQHHAHAAAAADGGVRSPRHRPPDDGRYDPRRALSLLKPPLALFLPYFAAAPPGRARPSRWRRALPVRVAVSIALFGVELHAFWFREFVLRQGSRPIAAYNVQSVNGFLGHLLTRGPPARLVSDRRRPRDSGC